MPGFTVIGLATEAIDLPDNVTEKDRNYRFQVTFGGGAATEQSPSITIDQTHIKSITRPIMRVKPFEMHHRTEDVSYPGKISYEPMTIVFYSQSGVTLKQIREWFDSRIYDVFGSRTLDNPDNRVDVFLEELDGLNNPTYRYSMYGAYIAERLGTVADYSNNEFAELTIVIKFIKMVETDLGISTKATNPDCEDLEEDDE